MRKFLFLILVFSACSFTASAVAKDTVAVDKYEEIGKLFEEAMDFVYSELSHYKADGKVITKAFFTDSVSVMLQKFSAAKGLKDNAFDNITGQPSDIPQFGPRATEFYNRATNLLNQIDGKSVEESVLALKNLRAEIGNSGITPAEIEPLLMYIAVGSHSMQYWDENYDKWQSHIFCH